MRSLSVMFALGSFLGLAIATTTSNSQNATAARPIAANFSNVTLRIGKQKGGWDLQLKLAGQDKFPYKVEYKEFTGGNFILQGINAGALDLGGASEIPPIFAIESKAAIKIIASRTGPTVGQVVLVPKNSTAKKFADLKGKTISYVRATTAHYFLIKMLEQEGLTLKDVNAKPLTIPDGLSAFRRGDLSAWATYGYAIHQARKDGAKVFRSAKNILSGNFVIAAAPSAIADPDKKAAIADFLCRVKKAQNWQESNIDKWSKTYAQSIGVDEKIVLEDAKEGVKQRRSQLLPISQKAIASQQDVADTFYRAGVIPSKVDVKPLWDASFTNAINQCK
ncbi:ABC transporter substrate-binding protein [Nostoc sp. NMS8]|uniref:ABC transporter substrate-binding protein n=1 Tax=Nostoc sp. NMS8 TaxID=2815392 RepID=UPI0025EB37D9|nr:ABC transporter substrate-binding protein [Nostoc sp. NMS8]